MYIDIIALSSNIRTNLNKKKFSKSPEMTHKSSLNATYGHADTHYLCIQTKIFILSQPIFYFLFEARIKKISKTRRGFTT